jgi:hypothetical protein
MNSTKLQTKNILGATLVATILETGPHWTGNEFIECHLIQFENGSTMNIATDRVGKDFLPLTDDSTPTKGAVSSHSWVLASLFNVESMSNDIPEHVYENDPTLEWVTCPCCDGERWLDTGHNPWTTALFSDSRRAYAHRHLNHSYKVCGRCNGVGEVLDDFRHNDSIHRQASHFQKGNTVAGRREQKEGDCSTHCSSTDPGHSPMPGGHLASPQSTVATFLQAA